MIHVTCRFKLTLNGSPKLLTKKLTWVEDADIYGNLKMLVHLVVGMGINTNFDCWPNIRHFDVNVMPRLSRNQREQAIGRLGAGQSAQILANAYNVNGRTIYRLQHRYNTTKQHQRSPALWSSPSHHTTTRLLYSAPTSVRPIHHNN